MGAWGLWNEGVGEGLGWQRGWRKVGEGLGDPRSLPSCFGIAMLPVGSLYPLARNYWVAAKGGAQKGV